jgi:hypothetical protein
MTKAKLVLMLARSYVEFFGENVLLIDLLVIKLYWLPGWFCERAGDEDGRSRAWTLIGDGEGRIGHGGRTIENCRRVKGRCGMRSVRSCEKVCRGLAE